MDKIFLTILNMSLTGAFVIAAVCLLRLLLKKAPKFISYCMWVVVGFRLLFPYSIESTLSLMPFKAEPIAPQNIIIQPDWMPPEVVPDNPENAISPQYFVPPVANFDTADYEPFPWFALLSYAWLTGTIVMIIYGVVSYIILKRKMRNSTHLQDNIYEAENIKSPFVLGIIKPRIFLPDSLPELSDREREYILLHEQTHIRRCDHIIKFVAYFVLCLHWFNPLAWIAFWLMGIDMEMSCDERVLYKMGVDTKKDYSRLLLMLGTERRFAANSPLAFGESGVKMRIRNVLKWKKVSRAIVTAAMVLAVVFSVEFAINRAETQSINEETLYSLLDVSQKEVYEKIGKPQETVNGIDRYTINKKSVSISYDENNNVTQINYDGRYVINTSRTIYYLENLDESLKTSKLSAVELNKDGTANLSTPPISSYLMPKCSYAFKDSELLIYAVIADKQEESFFSVKNNYIIARFKVIDDKTLEFKSATVPIFADEGARYVFQSLSIPETSYKPQKWIDFYNDDNMPWTSTYDLQLDEFPNVLFSWTSENVTATDKKDGEKTLFWGMPIWSVFLEDLNGDGLPEFCATVSFGSGIVDTRVIVYDYANKKEYQLADRSAYDYVLSLENGNLIVTQYDVRTTDGKRRGVGSLAIIDGELVVFGLDRTTQNYEPYMSSWQPLSDLPTDLNIEQAISNNMTVISHGQTYNQEQIDRFYTDVSEGSAAFMRVMITTIEGDAIITDYQYDGEVFMVTHDSTRDKFGEQKITTYTYKFLVSTGDSPPSSVAPNEYYLSNEKNIFRVFDNGSELIDGLWQVPSTSNNSH